MGEAVPPRPPMPSGLVKLLANTETHLMTLANNGLGIVVPALLSTRYQVTRIISVGIRYAEYYGHIGMRANI